MKHSADDTPHKHLKAIPGMWPTWPRGLKTSSFIFSNSWLYAAWNSGIKKQSRAKAAWSELSTFQATPFPVGLTKADSPSAWPSQHKYSLGTGVWKFKLHISHRLALEQPQQEKFSISTEILLSCIRSHGLSQGMHRKPEVITPKSLTFKEY